jgi:hypothetical protein
MNTASREFWHPAPATGPDGILHGYVVQRVLAPRVGDAPALTEELRNERGHQLVWPTLRDAECAALNANAGPLGFNVAPATPRGWDRIEADEAPAAPRMTLDQFRATRRDVVDLGRELGEFGEAVEGVAGALYGARGVTPLYLERVYRDPGVAVGWRLTIGNQLHDGYTLAELESRLYDWATTEAPDALALATCPRCMAIHAAADYCPTCGAEPAAPAPIGLPHYQCARIATRAVLDAASAHERHTSPLAIVEHAAALLRDDPQGLYRKAQPASLVATAVCSHRSLVAALRAIAASDDGQSDEVGGAGWVAAHRKLAAYARAALAAAEVTP